MKGKKILSLLLVLMLLLALFGCSSKEEGPAEEPSGQTDEETEPEEEEEPEHKDMETEIKDIIGGMTTEQKLAQMIIFSFSPTEAEGVSGDQLPQECRDMLAKYDFGGVILMGNNIGDAAQTLRLIRDCQSAAMESEPGIPLFVSVDQEGGLVNRVSYGMTGGGNMALAAAGDTALTEEWANMMAQEIAALGFNVDFAPVSDVNSNPNNPVIGVRSFSDDAQIAAQHVQAYIRGLRDNGIIAALKHFPGHGNVGEDSHTGLPQSGSTLEELRACELIPFEQGIAENAGMIMTAHIQFPEIEKETYVSVQDGEEVYLPATLSHTIIHDLLREEMGYDGIVITDSMVMGAIAAHFDPIDAATLAINAGVDILLMPVEIRIDGETNTVPDMEAYIAGLAERVASGEIKEEELDDSLYRILKRKMESGIMTNTLAKTEEAALAEAEAVVGAPEHLEREWEITQQGLTLLKNEGGLLPLDGNGTRTLVLYPSEYRLPSVEYAVRRMSAEGLARPENITALCFGEMEPQDEDFQTALAEADQVLLITQYAIRDDAVTALIDQVHGAGKPVVLLASNLPYDAACYNECEAILCAYNPYGNAHDASGDGPFSLNVATGILSIFGGSTPQGHLPVNVPVIEGSGLETSFTGEWLYERYYGLENWDN